MSENLSVMRAAENVANDVVVGRVPFEDFQRLGNLLAASGYFYDSTSRDVDAKTLAAQACTKMLAGAELGIGPVAALTGIHVIKGKVSVGANIQAQMVRRGGYNYKVLELDDTHCKLQFLRGEEVLGPSDYSLEDAKRARLLDKDNWKMHPKNMLFARAMSNGVKFYCPDVMKGGTVYDPDEAEELKLPAFAPHFDPELSHRGTIQEQKAVAEKKIVAMRTEQVDRELATPAPLTITDDDLPENLRGEDDAPVGPTPVTRASFNEDEWALILPYLAERGCDTEISRNAFVASWTEGKTELLAVAKLAQRERRKQ